MQKEMDKEREKFARNYDDDEDEDECEWMRGMFSEADKREEAKEVSHVYERERKWWEGERKKILET